MNPPKGKGPADAKQVMKRTQIDFENRMWATTKENAKTPNFMTTSRSATGYATISRKSSRPTKSQRTVYS